MYMSHKERSLIPGHLIPNLPMQLPLHDRDSGITILCRSPDRIGNVLQLATSGTVEGSLSMEADGFNGGRW